MTRVLLVLCSVWCFIFMISCEKDESKSMINPSSSMVVMEGEGGRTDITFDDGSWEIIHIVNQKGDVRISGNSYDLSGQMIRENYILSLVGTGRLESFWRDKGFRSTGRSRSLWRFSWKKTAAEKTSVFSLFFSPGIRSGKSK